MADNFLCGYCSNRDDCTFHLQQTGDAECSRFEVDPDTTEGEGWKGLAGLLTVEAKAKGRLNDGDLAEIALGSLYPAEEAAHPIGDSLAKFSRQEGFNVKVVDWERICHILEERIAK